MELELVDHPPVESGVDEAVVLEPLLVLLPLEVDEGGGAVVGLGPGGPALHDPTDEALVVALAQVVLGRRMRTVSCLGGWVLLGWA